jgi:hypothetical protein
MNKNIKTFIEMFYVIFMWNFFKTKYSFHNLWEVPLMNQRKLPNFFKHTINTRQYESKICPLGNFAGFAIAVWILFRDIVSQNSLKNDLKKINIFIFSVVLILSFAMNLNAFIYFIPVFIYEFKLI